MADPIKYLNSGGLYDLKSVGQHMLHSARRDGNDTSTPLAFLGAITVAIGCKMMWDAWRNTKKDKPGFGRSR